MLFPAGMLLLFVSIGSAQSIAPSTADDSDHDGLSDVLENALLVQFAPRFMVSGDDCSVRPALFVPFQAKPTVEIENGTIYGQVFPRVGHADQVEAHYYHLWRTDCGEMGHNLDTEHVSVLLVRDEASTWRARYWYAAAHEDTVCDAGQITRAGTIDAELHGPEVWISLGKHASFLSEAICAKGCGGDNCHDMVPLATANVINLGELHAPMNGSTWIDSPEWPLAAKMSRSDFTEARMARLDPLSATSIAWAEPERRPGEAVIRSGLATRNGLAVGDRETDMALDLANADTGKAMAIASNHTGNGLSRAYRNVRKALGKTARNVGGTIAGPKNSF
ncbi:MAG TPA: hypothetical protein VGG45_02745 [Terracidiphilus sp.]